MRRGVALSIVALSFCISSGAAAQNLDNGETVFKKCRACHTIGPDAANRVGPPLNAIIGRKAGLAEGYTYSDANKEAGANGLVWTEEVLFKYLETPMQFMPKTKMVFPGLKDDADRRDVIAFLKQFSAK